MRSSLVVPGLRIAMATFIYSADSSVIYSLRSVPWEQFPRQESLRIPVWCEIASGDKKIPSLNAISVKAVEGCTALSGPTGSEWVVSHLSAVVCSICRD